MPSLSTAALVGSFAASALAHGTVQGIRAGGQYYTGYSPSFQYQNPPPKVIGWSIPEDQDNGFVAPDAFANPDIICHKGATPGQVSAKVAAGDTVELMWTEWPESHHGPVIDYLAKCSGKCEQADKESLKFFKINQGGLNDGSTPPGDWASDDLIANNNTWSVEIPTDIAPGNYVLRHEIIALHSAGEQNGAQNYPQCINLEVSSSGTANPAGVAGTALYKATDPGILVNIYTALTSYKIPGPPVYGGGSSPQPSAPASSAPASSAGAGSSSAGAASSSYAASGSAPAGYPSAGPSSSLAAGVSGSSSSYIVTASNGGTSSSEAAPSGSSYPASYPAGGSSSSYAGPASGSSSYAASYSYGASSSGGAASGSSSYASASGSASYSYGASSSGGAASGSSSYASASGSASYPASYPAGSSSSYAGPASGSSSYAASSSAFPASSSDACVPSTVTVTVYPSSSFAAPESSAAGGSSYSYPAASSSSYGAPASSSAYGTGSYSIYPTGSFSYSIYPTGSISIQPVSSSSYAYSYGASSSSYAAPASSSGAAESSSSYVAPASSSAPAGYPYPPQKRSEDINARDVLDWAKFSVRKHAREHLRRHAA